MKKEIFLFAILFAVVLAIATESFAQCSRLGARDWIAGEYQFCDGTDWQAFSYDGTAGVCTVPAEIEWDGNEAAYTVCDGSDRQIIRYAINACSLTSAMLDVGASIADAAWEDQISAFTIYDGGTKAIAHGRWATNFLTFDISGAPAAPSVITLSPSVSGRVDSADLVVRNGYVFAPSTQMDGDGRLWASPLSDLTTVYSYPASGSVSGNRMCHANGLAMNDTGTAAFVPAWDSGGSTCTYGNSYGGCILNIFDTSDPTDMDYLTHVDLSSLATNGNIYCTGAYFREDKLFVPFASGPGDGGLMILDVSTPSSPSLLGQTWLGGLGNSQFDYMDISEDGNTAILGSRAGRVVSVDVSNPSNPTILDSDLFVPISSWISDVLIVKNYAFVAANPNYSMQ